MCRGRRSDALGLSRELCGDAPVELDMLGIFQIPSRLRTTYKVVWSFYCRQWSGHLAQLAFQPKCCANHNRCWLPPGRHSPHLCKRLPTISDVKLHRPCNICVPVISACSEQRKTEAYSVNCMLTTYNKTNCKKKLQWINREGVAIPNRLTGTNFST